MATPGPQGEFALGALEVSVAFGLPDLADSALWECQSLLQLSSHVVCGWTSQEQKGETHWG